MLRTAFIINPRSAKNSADHFLRQLKARIPDPLVHISQSVQSTHDFILENFDEADIFVAVGGDGTISSVASNLLNTSKLLAVIPAGSGNGFSREMKFSSSLDHLLGKIKAANVEEIDTFTVNGRISVNVSGTGFDGEVIQTFEQTSRGFANYIRTSVAKYRSYRPIKVRFEEKYSDCNGEYLMINVANTRQFGNNAFIAPHASHSDGLLEIALVRKFPFIHAPVFAYRMFSKKLIPNQYIKYLSVPEIRFEVDSDVWHLDGEGVKIPSPVHIKIWPKSLKIVV